MTAQRRKTWKCQQNLPVLNADLGEGDCECDQALLPHLGLVNVACGGHAGDESSMHGLLAAALELPYLRVGAHPSYPDREHFGRRPLAMGLHCLRDSLVSQVSSLQSVALHLGIKITHCKAHGALYHAQLHDDEAFEAVMGAMEVLGKGSILLLPAGLLGDRCSVEAMARGFGVWRESFADRRYLADGSIMARQHEEAMIREPDAIVQQAHSLMALRRVCAVDGRWMDIVSDTVCVHGDHQPSRVAASRIAALSIEDTECD